MEPLIKTTEQLVNFLVSCYGDNYNRVRTNKQGAYVTTSVRKEFMTSEYQGKITVGGKVITPIFQNQGGGVYHVRLYAGTI